MGETLTEGAPKEIIRFIEYIWQDDNVDVSIAKVSDKDLILSYLIAVNE